MPLASSSIEPMSVPSMTHSAENENNVGVAQKEGTSRRRLLLDFGLAEIVNLILGDICPIMPILG